MAQDSVAETFCTCQGAQHVVCRPKWVKVGVHITLPTLPKAGPSWRVARKATTDPVAWAMAEIRRVGIVPATFTYRAPNAKPAAVDNALDCQCKGKQHPVCLPAAQWKTWMKAVHRYLDRETLRPEPADVPAVTLHDYSQVTDRVAA